MTRDKLSLPHLPWCRPVTRTGRGIGLLPLLPQLFFGEASLLWINSQVIETFFPRISFTTPTILRIVFRLSLYVLMGRRSVSSSLKRRPLQIGHKLLHYRFIKGVQGQGTESGKDVFGDSIK
jgi:hypothetical protein